MQKKIPLYFSSTTTTAEIFENAEAASAMPNISQVYLLTALLILFLHDMCMVFHHQYTAVTLSALVPVARPGTKHVSTQLC